MDAKKQKKYMAQSTRIIDQLDKEDCVGRELNAEADRLRKKQEWDKAIELAHRSLDLCRQKDNMRYRRSAGVATMHLAAIHHAKGELNEAARLYQNSGDYFANDRRNRSISYLALGIARQANEDSGAAIDAYQLSLDILAGGLDPRLYAEASKRLEIAVKACGGEQATGKPPQQLTPAPQPTPAVTHSDETSDPQQPPVLAEEAPQNPPDPDVGAHSQPGQQDTGWLLGFVAVYLLVIFFLVLVLALLGFLRGDRDLLIAAAIISLVTLLLPLAGWLILLPWLERKGWLCTIESQVTAIIEEGGSMKRIDGPARLLCLPQSRRVRAFTPTWKQTYSHIGQVTTQDGEQVKPRISVMYDVADPEKATAFALQQKGQHPRAPLASDELKQIWDNQVAMQLSPALAHSFAGQQAEQAWEQRDILQTDIETQLITRTHDWGLAIKEVCIHQIQRDKKAKASAS
jgi:tetratricopeptide (TPR) repeat protein